MKIPRKVRIVGLDWQIIPDDDFCKENRVHGATNSMEQWIKYQPSNSRQLQEQTLMHELLHAVWWSMGLKEHFKDRDEEKIINALSNGIYQALNDNGFLKDS